MSAECFVLCLKNKSLLPFFFFLQHKKIQTSDTFITSLMRKCQYL